MIQIKNIFFDYGGTIDSNGIHWRKRFYDLYIKNGIEISYDDFSKAFFDSDDNLSLRHNLKGCGINETVIFNVNDVFKYLRINDDLKARRIAEEFISDTKKSISNNISVFKGLKEKGIKLGVISNFYGNLRDVLSSLDILKYFDTVADSSVIGHIKPDKEIFLWALNSIDAKPEESAMVGDAMHRDILGAHNLGMYHFYLTQDNTNSIKKCCDKFFTIRNLTELFDYV